MFGFLEVPSICLDVPGVLKVMIIRIGSKIKTSVHAVQGVNFSMGGMGRCVGIAATPNR